MTELQKRETALKKSLRLLYVYAIAAGAIFCYIGYYDTFFISYCGPSTFLAFALMMLAILPIALVCCELAPMFPTVGAELVYNTVGPVSYTHLDVYKRQTGNRQKSAN